MYIYYIDKSQIKMHKNNILEIIHLPVLFENKTMVLFSNKNFFNYKINLVPKCHIQSNIHVITSKSGTMDKEIMKSWINTCLKISGPFRNLEKSILIMDSFGSHKDESVLQLLKKNNYDPIIIPPRTTSFLQPLDVLINAPFKAYMKQEWEHWQLNGVKEYTIGGYRKKPSWNLILQFISNSLLRLSEDTISKSFHLCGIKDGKVNLDYNNLNEKLISILNNTTLTGEEYSSLFEDSSNEDLLEINH